MMIALAALWFVLGGIVGSFLNVVVYRVPAGLSVVSPGSHCPKCDRPIRWYDNVPILAWLWLRGRCRDCSAPISPRYPLVELLTATVFLSVGWVQTWVQATTLPGQAASLRMNHRVARSFSHEGSDSNGIDQSTRSLDGWELLTAAAPAAVVQLTVLSTLLSAALIAFDGGPMLRRLFAPAWIMGILAYAPELGAFPWAYAGFSPPEWWTPWTGALAGLVSGAVVQVLLLVSGDCENRRASLQATSAPSRRNSVSTSGSEDSGTACAPRWVTALLLNTTASFGRSAPICSLGCLGLLCGPWPTVILASASITAATVVAAANRCTSLRLPVMFAGSLFVFAWVWFVAVPLCSR